MAGPSRSGLRGSAVIHDPVPGTGPSPNCASTKVAPAQDQTEHPAVHKKPHGNHHHHAGSPHPPVPGV